MFTTLHRYLLRQNLFLFTLIFGLGMGIYLLVDVFDRLEKFLNEGVAASTIAWYFVLKIPLIITQLLPIIFLLSILIQLGVMRRAREITALEASAITNRSMSVFFIVYSLFWVGIHLLFSQQIGFASDRESTRIWDTQVRKREVDNRHLSNVWFKDGRNMVSIKKITPAQKKGQGLTIYTLNENNSQIIETTTADSFVYRDDTWKLTGVEILNPAKFTRTAKEQATFPLQTDPTTFTVIDPKTDPEGLSIWQLSEVIQELKDAGAGIARLQTVWHMKLAYTFSIVALTVAALAIATLTRNIYLTFFMGLGSVFIYYVVFLTGVSAGQKGALPPAVAAWTADLLIFGISTLVLIRKSDLFRNLFSSRS